MVDYHPLRSNNWKLPDPEPEEEQAALEPVIPEALNPAAPEILMVSPLTGGEEVVTKTLETLVLPTLKHAPFTYEVTDNGNTVLFVFRVSRFTCHWTVVGHTKPQVLSIEAWNIVSVAPDNADILKRLNELNATCTGKFWLVDQEHLKYCLELPYTDDTTPALFQHALFLALDTVATNYKGWWEHSRSYKTLYQKIEEVFGSEKPNTNQRKEKV